MNKLQTGIAPVLKTVSQTLKQNRVVVEIAAAGLGFTGAVGLTVKATVQAVRRTDYEREKKGRELTVKELAEASWKYYIPAAMLWGGSLISLIMAAKGHQSGTKLLAAVYAASEAERKKLEDAALEYLGPKKYEEMQTKAADLVLQEAPMDGNMVYETGHGNHLCYDTYSGRFFRCCIDHIKRSVNDFNNELYTHQTGKSYNDLFYEISPVFEDIEFGKDVGWNYIHGGADIRYSSHLKNGEPCLVMTFKKRPYPRYEEDW